MPQRDEHHQRNVRETLQGTWTYKGSKSGIKGEIDTEADITEHAAGKGWEEYPEQHRSKSWDTDQDGMPDWWELCTGSDSYAANQNDDPDGDGWTLLENYLDFMAHPYIIIEPNQSASIDLKPYFEGFYGQNGNSVIPTYSYDTSLSNGLYAPSINGSVLTIRSTKPDTQSVGQLYVTVDDGETTFSQRFGIAITSLTTAIRTVCNNIGTNVHPSCYDLYGRRITKPTGKGLYICNGQKVILK